MKVALCRLHMDIWHLADSVLLMAGQAYDANAYWSKASNSAHGTSADSSDMQSSSRTHSHSSSSTVDSYQSHSLQPTADDITLAAAVAAIDVAAEAALEADIIDELPYLPDTAVADAASSSVEAAEVAPSTAVGAVQAGIDSLATAVKGLFGPNQTSTDPRLLEIAVVADGSAIPWVNEPAPVAPQEKPQGVAGLRQKSKSEKRPRLLLLSNGLLIPMPTQPVSAPLQNEKQLIADGLKVGVAPTKQPQKGSDASVMSEASPTVAISAKLPHKGLEASVRFVAAADSPTVADHASLRRASVTSKGSQGQALLPAKRSKSFSASSAAPDSSTEGRISPVAVSASQQSPFHKAARTQISQHVERSSASTTVHGSAGKLDIIQNLPNCFLLHADIIGSSHLANAAMTH